MRVVVAGGSGFVGRHVVAELIARGHEVVTLDRGRRVSPDGARSVRFDLASEVIPAEAFSGADAVVNLVGIKRARGVQTFEAVHVDGTRRLIDAAHAAGAPRFVHVSVVGCRPDPASPYHETKWRAEEQVRASGLRATILRPGVIYGAGDDMITHLVEMIRGAPVFPIVGAGTSLLQPVDVRDVAAALAAVVERPETSGRTYDVVGRQRLMLRQVVSAVAEALALPIAIVPTPLWLLRPILHVWSRWSAAALSTPSQLRLLEQGMVGDPEPARRDLGLDPRPFTAKSVAEVVAKAPARPVPPRGAWLVTAAAVALSFALGALVPNVWYRMAAMGSALTVLSLVAVRLPWRALLTPTRRAVLLGVAAAVVMYAGGAAVFVLLQRSEAAALQIAALYAWREAVPRVAVWPLLLLIVVMEEVVWRNAVTLPLAARFGLLKGAAVGAAAFALAHVAMGVPLLVLAALGAGLFWGLLVVRTGSAVPALVCHLLWDAAVLLVAPYPEMLARS